MTELFCIGARGGSLAELLMYPTSGVLLVRGDPPAQALSKNLDEHGIRCAFASSMEEALEIASAQYFGVVVTQDVLPDGDGLSLLRALRTRAPNLIGALISSTHDFALACRAVNLYQTSLLAQEPLDDDDLLALIMDACSVAQDRDFALGQKRERENQLRQLLSWTKHVEGAQNDQQTHFLLAILAALEHKAPVMLSHGRRVATHAATMAQSCGAGATTLQAVVDAARLHDLSMLAVPDDVLLKPAPLHHDEWPLLMAHVDVGERILLAWPGKQEARQIFAEHHERWDGKGYPHGKQADDISLGARIFAVSDAYVAMTSNRPYRPGMAPELAQEQLLHGAGNRFDPSVVAAFSTTTLES